MDLLPINGGFTSFSSENREQILQFLARQAVSQQRLCSHDIMIVLALACNTHRSWMRHEILWWISVHFPSERHEIASTVGNWYKTKTSTNIGSRLQSSTLPLMRSRDGESYRYIMNDRYIMYSITAPAALCMLLPVVSPAPTGQFNFMRLPVELRVLIYKEVLLQPGHVFALGLKECRYGLLLTDETGFPAQLNDEPLRIDNIQKTLAILSASHQTFGEACPIFYGQNRFYAAQVKALDAFLGRLAPSRRKHLTDVMFTYGSDAQKAFRLLPRCDSLRKVGIGGIHESFERSARPDRFRLNVVSSNPRFYKCTTNVPGFTDLAALRGIESLTFQYPCRRLEAYLRPLVTQPRKAPGETTRPKADKIP